MKKFNILIVDEDSLIFENLDDSLKLKYNIILVNEIKEAFSILTSKIDITAILISFSIARMNDYEFLKSKNKISELNFTSTIIFGDNFDYQKQLKLLQLKATDFVRLPIEKKLITQRIDNLVDLRIACQRYNLVKFDRTTMLYNLDTFNYLLDAKIKEDNLNYYLVSSKIVNYQSYSSIFGEDVCNKIVKYVANRLKLISNLSMLAHTAVDIFTFIIKKDDTLIFSIMEEIENELNNHLEYEIKLQFGITIIEDSSEESLNCCRQALKSIENNFMESYAFFDKELKVKYMEEKKIYLLIEKAIENNEIQVLFQKKVDLITRECVGYEILSRWEHPELGFIYPHFYIPILERNNKIFILDSYVWKEAIKAISLLKKPVSVNVSEVELYSSAFKPYLLNLVKKYDINPAMLHLEISNYKYIENREYLFLCLKELRSYGFMIEMQDFEADFTRYKKMQDFPIDFLKIDMKYFVEKKQLSIVKFIIELAHELGLKVIASGISDLYLANTVKVLDCDYGQGYYFNRAARFDDLIEGMNYG